MISQRLEPLYWNARFISTLFGEIGIPSVFLRADKRIRNLENVDLYIKNYKNIKEDNFKKSLIIDRLGKGNYKLFKASVKRKYNKIPVPKDFESAVELDLKEILKTPAENYYIFWSGGIDSTLMLVAFLKFVDWGRIKVVHTRFDPLGRVMLNEYPLFYSWLIKNQIKIIDFEEYWKVDSSKDLILHGLGGDAIWGYLYNWYEEEETENKKNSNKNWRQDNTFNFDADTFNFFHNFCLESDIDIITAQQARCWFFQTAGHQSSTHAHSFIFSSPFSQKIQSFYDNDHISRWVLANPDEIVAGDIETYKMPAKEYINDFFPDGDYLKNMKKKHSWGTRENWLKLSNNRIPFLLDNDNQWHTLPSQPKLIGEEFLEWNKTHNWLPING